ncbi:cation:proton antiporter [Amorphus orientalis]|uniref:CPA1 family monovalent cation:H+ antiporter n=1 Tax=Amorphus orientalis TaxID=649198 RepID=A0AAE4AQZ9_9HYPH|nr:cation:proton antiporter [Amorphus orientalis]MDQ0313662.1 CPA1 family monovalent cation:H+ antiporter [Amorphus orientalis]
MSLPYVLAAVAGLLVIIGLTEPLARRLKLPPSVLLAGVGILLGGGASLLLYSNVLFGLDNIAVVFAFPPLNSEVFLYILLPALLFQASLSLDVRRLMEDAAPIFLLAVVAVIVSTFAIGYAVAPVSGEPLLLCLLLGAIVATTDPVAVIAIFRDLGAPARLTRLVEGESLLNDAAAIALFVLLLEALTSGTDITPRAAAETLAFSAAGGLLAGLVGGWCALALFNVVRHVPAALMTISLALPYLVYVVCELALDVSGVIAVVAAALVVATGGPTRVPPDAWTQVKAIWDQLAFWASSLIFVLASLLVPKLLGGVDFGDLLSLVVLIAAALAARAAVLFLLAPVLTLARLSERMPPSIKAVILWGGLRGAVTLALALAVTENTMLDQDQKRFIAVLATGFTLFTILVNGLSLRPLIRLLRLDQLSPFDRALRDEVLALALGNVRETVATAADEYDIAPAVAREAGRPYDARIAAAKADADKAADILDRDRVTLGLVALADQERSILLEHVNDRTVSLRIVSQLIVDAERMRENARASGRVGYRRAARRSLGYPIAFRVALRIHRYTGYDRWLITELAERFERLLVSRIVLGELVPYVRNRLAPLLGERVGEIVEDILALRRESVAKALAALRLQYPDYANDLERRFLLRIATQHEDREYRNLYHDHLIGAELYSALQRGIEQTRESVERGPRLDLGMRTRDLIAQFPLFKGLTPDQIDRVVRLLRPRFAVPGERLIRKGDRGDSVYFISSGAVEVAAEERRVRLGRGDFIGELALLYGGRRNADVTALGYCQLLVLEGEAFKKLVDRYPEIGAEVERVAQARLAANPATDHGVEISGPGRPDGGGSRASYDDDDDEEEDASARRFAALMRWRSPGGS